MIKTQYAIFNISPSTSNIPARVLICGFATRRITSEKKLETDLTNYVSKKLSFVYLRAWNFREQICNILECLKICSQLAFLHFENRVNIKKSRKPNVSFQHLSSDQKKLKEA